MFFVFQLPLLPLLGLSCHTHCTLYVVCNANTNRRVVFFSLLAPYVALLAGASTFKPASLTLTQFTLVLAGLGEGLKVREACRDSSLCCLYSRIFCSYWRCILISCSVVCEPRSPGAPENVSLSSQPTKAEGHGFKSRHSLFLFFPTLSLESTLYCETPYVSKPNFDESRRSQGGGGLDPTPDKITRRIIPDCSYHSRYCCYPGFVNLSTALKMSRQ